MWQTATVTGGAGPPYTGWPRITSAKNHFGQADIWRMGKSQAQDSWSPRGQALQEKRVAGEKALGQNKFGCSRTQMNLTRAGGQGREVENENWAEGKGQGVQSRGATAGKPLRNQGVVGSDIIRYAFFFWVFVSVEIIIRAARPVKRLWSCLLKQHIN